MRAPIAAVVALVLVLMASGCTAAPGQAPTAGPTIVLSDELEQLRSAEGVQDAMLTTADPRGRAGLRVVLDESIGAEALAAVGALVEAFAVDSPVDPVLTLVDSQFAYFDGVHGDALRAQLEYWLALVRTGPDSVTVLKHHPGQTAALGTAPTAEPHADGADATPRYVLVDLPADLARADRAELVTRLGAVPDPGAPSGQWDLLDLAPSTKGEYVGAAFPERERLRLDADLGELFADAPGLAGIQVHRDDSLAPSTRVQIVIFDLVMDGAASDDAEQRFGETRGFERLVDAVELLERPAAGDYHLTVLSSPLRDGGSFELRLSVTGCDFIGDARWESLSGRLADRWQASIAPHRRAALAPGDHCSIDGIPVP